MSGIIIIPILVIYAFFCYIIYRIVLGKTQKWLLSVTVFFAVLTFPFWDLIIDKGIEKFYNTFGLLEPIVYEMPERDKNGKIESIGGWLMPSINIENLEDKEKLNILLNKLREDNISEFVEFRSRVGSYKDNSRKRVIIKVNLYNKEKPYEIIEKSQARYIQKYRDKYDFNFFVIVIRNTEYYIYDNKKQKVIATAQTMPAFNFLPSIFVRHYILHASGLFSRESNNYVDEMRNDLFKDIRIVR